MMRVALLLVAVLVPASAVAQQAPVTAGNGAGSQTMVRAAGMPLNDGSLAPGVLTVRVVEGAFTRDVSGQAVDVQVTGGKTERAMTGADGRAQFPHLPIGGEVRASALVGDERLESDAFMMPSDSGVRLLLVVGAGAGATTTTPPHPPDAGGFAGPAASTPVVPPPVVPPAASSTSPGSAVWTIRVALVLTTVSVFALFVLRWRPRRA